MPRSKDVNKYPREYFEIVRVVGEEGKELRVQAKSRAEAYTLRARFYAFRKGVEELARTAKGKAEARTDGENTALDLFEAAMRVMVEVQGEQVIFYHHGFHKDVAPIQDALRRAVGEERSAQGGAEASLARLQAAYGEPGAGEPQGPVGEPPKVKRYY